MISVSTQINVISFIDYNMIKDELSEMKQTN